MLQFTRTESQNTRYSWQLNVVLHFLDVQRLAYLFMYEGISDVNAVLLVEMYVFWLSFYYISIDLFYRYWIFVLYK